MKAKKMVLTNFPIDDTANGGNTFGSTTAIDAMSSEAVMLPRGQFVSDTQYTRHDTDLHLIGPDGATVIVHDYYLADHAPDLMTPEGGKVTTELVNSVTQPEAAGQYTQAESVQFEPHRMPSRSAKTRAPAAS